MVVVFEQLTKRPGVMTPLQCTCGRSIPVEPTQSAVVCPQCGRELRLAGPDELTVAREPTGPGATPVVSFEAGNSSQQFIQSEASSDGIGPYRQLELLRPWRYGTLFKAYHPTLDRHVLLRVLAPEHAGNPAVRDAFLRRAAELSKLNHPNVISVLEAGEDRGLPFVAEEMFYGQPLDGFSPRTRGQRWREGIYPNHKLCQTMIKAAAGLEAVHHAGLVHGQLNRESVRMDSTGALKIVDFFEGLEIAGDPRSPLAPSEHWNFDRPAQRDVFSLAALFYWLGTNQLPDALQASSESDQAGDWLYPAKKLNPGLSIAFSEILSRCLSREPNWRFRSCADLQGELDRLVETRVVHCTRRKRVYSVVAEMFIAALLATMLQQPIRWLLIRLHLIQFDQDPGKLAADMAMINGSFFFAIPILYVLGMESIAGWTAVRRLCGLYLTDFAGDRASFGRRVARVFLKFFILLAPLFLLIAITVQEGFGIRESWFLFGIVFPLLSAALALATAYVRYPSMATGMTLHDFLTGVILVERQTATTAVPQPSTIGQAADLTAAPLRECTGSVDQYDVYDRLGGGGMGTVYRARDRSLGREVALKTLAEHLIGDEVQLQRFEREARLAAQLSHPHMAKVFGAGRWGKSPYIAMELIDGENLQQCVERDGPLKLDVAWRYCLQAAEALREADRHQIVHRDIKPSNMMVTKAGSLKITDFGISRTVDSEMHVTKTGTILGTPWYMSPEQAMGKEVDRRSDIYSLGMTMYFLLTGRPAFSGSNPMEVLAQQVADEAPPLEGKVPSLTERQAAILHRMIAKKKENRHADYDSLLNDLRREQPGAAAYAGMASRLTAELMNCALLFLLFLCVTIPVFIMMDSWGREYSRVFDLLIPSELLSVLIAFLLMYVWGIGRRGKTLGKHWMKLRVTRPDGQRVGYRRAALRFLLTYPFFFAYAPFVITWQLDVASWLYLARLVWRVIFWCNLAVLALSAVFAWRHPQRRMVHDLLTDTVVVRIPEPEKER